MSDFGARLKHARESRGLSLRQIATSTKISTVALEALERGDLSKLPGGIFSRAFVKAYAQEVGLDPEEVAAEFVTELGEHASRTKRDDVRPEVTADDRAFLEQQRKAAVALRVALVVVILLVIAVVVFWQMRRSASPVPVVTPDPPAVAVTPSDAQSDDDVAADAAGGFGEAPSPTGPAAAVGLWIELVARDNCWIQVTTDGTPVPSRVMAPGERQRFEAKTEIVLQVGNAGAVALTVNGRAARPLGGSGDVRTVTISSSNASTFYQDELPTPSASATDRP